MEDRASFTSEIGRILRSSRDIESNPIENRIYLAIAMAVRIHTSSISDNQADIGRLPGSAFAQDHRRMRFGQRDLIRGRSSRSTWR